MVERLSNLKLVNLSEPQSVTGAAMTWCVGILVAVRSDGALSLKLEDGVELDATILHTGAGANPVPAVGETWLVGLMPAPVGAIAFGRLGPRAAAAPHLVFEATESLTLKCGEASVELRADGRAMVKGEDVLLRAKGTQRIRAGNVAIN